MTNTPEKTPASTLNGVRALWLEALEREVFDESLNFFDNGGDSLATTLVIATLREEYGVVITLEEFFDHSTLIQLSELVDKKLRDDQRCAASAKGSC